MAEKRAALKTVINQGTVIGSTYSQIVGVTVSNIDIMLEFAFINPRDPSKGQVVSRVTMPINVGVNLAQTILKTMQAYEKKGGS